MSQEVIFMYGLPASGKTTLSKAFEKRSPEYVRIGADDVRRELYGSDDVYGDGEEIYHRILQKMKAALDGGLSVLYDAVNMKQSYRLDFFRDLLEQYPEAIKSIVKVPTMANVCHKRFFHRNGTKERLLSFEKVAPYFDRLHFEEPTLSEGWDHIYVCCAKAYVASPFFAPEHRARAVAVAEHLRSMGIETYLPLEIKIDNAWDYPNYEWGRLVYENDKAAIDQCDTVVMLSYGRMGSAGTAWEAGYAFGIGKRVIVVEMPEVELMSLMISNGCYSVIKGIDGLASYDFLRMPVMMDYDMEQK